MTTLMVLAHIGRPINFVIGVFEDDDTLYQNLFGLMLQQKNFNSINTEFNAKFGKRLSDYTPAVFADILRDVDYISKNTDNEANFVEKKIKIAIFEEEIGKLFNFTGFGPWDDNSLNKALEMVVVGETGMLINFWPYKSDDLFK